jgi:hypothetical protein
MPRKYVLEYESIIHPCGGKEGTLPMNRKLNPMIFLLNIGKSSCLTRISLFFLILTAALQGSVQSWAEPTPLATLDEVVAQLPHTDVSGQVVDKSGRPLPEADVFVYYARGIRAD